MNAEFYLYVHRLRSNAFIKENLISLQSFGSMFKRLKFYLLIRFIHRTTEGS